MKTIFFKLYHPIEFSKIFQRPCSTSCCIRAQMIIINLKKTCYSLSRGNDSFRPSTKLSVRRVFVSYQRRLETFVRGRDRMLQRSRILFLYSLSSTKQKKFPYFLLFYFLRLAICTVLKLRCVAFREYNLKPTWSFFGI